MSRLVAEFGTGQVVWSMLWVALCIILIWLVIAVLVNVFRSPDLSGWGKALWTIFVVLFPFLGVLVYLGARGMAETPMRVPGD
jgi:hypothetical protein